MQDERLHRIVLLLTTQDDYLQPWTDSKTSTGRMVAASTLPGPGPSQLRDCKRCDGIGKMLGNRPCPICAAGDTRAHNCSICPTCQGARRLWYDDYTGAAVEAAPEHRPSSGSGEGAHARRHGSASQQDLGDKAHLWDRARQRHRAGTSRPALVRAMEQLREEDPVAQGLVRSCYVEKRYGNPERPRCDEGTRWIIARGLVRLSQLMPDEIRLPLSLEEQMNGHNRAAQARRLVTDEGLSRREASRRLGVSRGHLAVLLRRP